MIVGCTTTQQSVPITTNVVWRSQFSHLSRVVGFGAVDKGFISSSGHYKNNLIACKLVNLTWIKQQSQI